MNIVVFIKQVPDTNDVKWTQNNNIDRTKMDSIINPVDKQAIEAALRLKEAYSANITAITMGPSKSLEVLKEAMALGVDDAAILSDSKFSGSDTCATSKVLAAAVKEKFPDTDLVLFGQSAIDGETSQTGPSTAVRLGYPFVCHVNEIVEINNDKIIINTETETYKEVLEIQMPAVLCISNYVFKPRIPKINGYIRSQDYNYKSYNIYELNIPETQTGVKGSPTYVSNVYKRDDSRDCRMIYAKDNDNFANEIMMEIKEIMGH